MARLAGDLICCPTLYSAAGAVMWYLCEKFDEEGKLLPKGLEQRTAVNCWLMFQIGGLGPMQGQAHHFVKAPPPPPPPPPPPTPLLPGVDTVQARAPIASPTRVASAADG